ncbi:MAG: response regulator transcription factor [Acidimicrobiales bacterium]
MRVLLVEDDDAVAGAITDGLGRAGFTVERVATGEAALSALPTDLVLLDLGLPDLDGLEVCRELRQRSSVAIIVITARSDELDRVMGLELGADDYVVKPFGLRELIARIRAVTRRLNASHEHGAEHEPSQQIGNLDIDRRSRRVHVDGREVALGRKEFNLLTALADDAGAVISRERLIEEVWDRHSPGPSKTLDVHVASLRRKLGHAEWIETIRGVGYRLEVT